MAHGGDAIRLSEALQLVGDILVPRYQLPGRTRYRQPGYQDQLRQSPELPATNQVALGALPV